MLSPADADLARRDPGLPGLATLLDPDAFAAALGRTDPVRVTYVRYKPGRSCLVGYRLGDRDVVASAYRPSARDKLEKAGSRPGRIVLADRSVTVAVFPDDDALGVLPRLADPDGRTAFLRKLLPERPDLWTGVIEAVRYKPGRRYVGRLVAGGTARAAVKVYAPAGYGAAAVNAKAFKSCPGFRRPARLGRSARHCTLALEWLPGRPLNEALADPAFDPRGVEAVGAALAALHAQNPVGLTTRTRAAEAAGVGPLAEWLAHVCPDLTGRTRRTAGRLAATLANLAPADRPVHGDYYAKQVIVGGDRVGLLDFDEAFRGDPAHDLGSFLAHLYRDVLRDTVPADSCDAVRAALLAGYGSHDRNRVAIYTAVGLLRLAPHPFRNREPDWSGRTAALISRAEAELRSVTAGLVPVGGGVSRASVPVHDPFGAAADSKLPFLAAALCPDEAASRLAEAVPAQAARGLRAIRVTRHKPGRRCLVEYEFGAVTLIGKVRAKGVDHSTYDLMRRLWAAGFDADSPDGVSVPEPVGLVPAFGMWLQRKVPGVPGTRLLASEGGVALARRIAGAVHKLHRAGVPATRTHTPGDELEVLDSRLGELARERPEWGRRLEVLFDACRRLVAETPRGDRCGTHRDFYPDQVLVDGSRLYLLDFDLYCEADPALDAGNFLGHLTEYAVRATGRADAMADVEDAFADRFAELSGDTRRPAVRVYTLLTLARHVGLSRRFPDRQAFTERLLGLCEERLGCGTPAHC